MAKGARRPKSPFRGQLDLFYLADFSFARSRRSELHNLREIVLRETHESLRHDLTWLQQASYCAALIEQTTETETPLPQIYELLTGLLRQLAKHPPRPLTIFAFEMKLLNELGQLPDFQESKLCAGTKQILEKLTQLDWPALSNLKPSAPQTRELEHFLHGFLIYHLGKIPKGRSAALVSD